MANYDDDDIQLVDIDDDGGESNSNALDKKAREPKTDMQKRFIQLFPGTKRFPTKGHQTRFRAFERFTLSGTDEAVMHRGYLQDISAWVKSKNVTQIIIMMHVVLKMLEDKDRYRNYAASPEAKQFLKDNKSSVKNTVGIKTIGRSLSG